MCRRIHPLRSGFVVPGSQLRFHTFPVLSDVLQRAGYVPPVRTRRALVLAHRFPRFVQVFFLQHHSQRWLWHFHGSFIRPHLTPPPATDSTRRTWARHHWRNPPPVSLPSTRVVAAVATPMWFRPPSRRIPAEWLADGLLLVLRPFALHMFPRASSLLWPLLTPPALSRQRPPGVRCMNALWPMPGTRGGASRSPGVYSLQPSAPPHPLNR